MSLAEIWNASQNRPAIANAANQIDAILESRPDKVGESRADNSRLLYIAPLAIYYDVEVPDRRARVWAV